MIRGIKNFINRNKEWGSAPQKQVTWDGWYEQGGNKTEMKFENMQVHLDGAVFGSGQDTNGKFSIQGSMSQNGQLQFVKQYEGAHAVHYTGSVEDGMIQGKWSIPNNCDGTFGIVMNVEKCKGWYEQEGQKTDMELELSIDENGVFGIGKDPIGNFVVRGLYKKTGPLQPNKVMFVKQYVGAHVVNYEGKVHGQTIKGEWEMEGFKGKFELKKDKHKPKGIGGFFAGLTGRK